MARSKLGRLEEERRTFIGTFERLGTKRGYTGQTLETLLLTQITDMQTGRTVANHLWFNCTKGFKALGRLEAGMEIKFDGRVKPYIKGYRGTNIDKQIEKPIYADWKIDRPTKIELAQSELKPTSVKSALRSPSGRAAKTSALTS